MSHRTSRLGRIARDPAAAVDVAATMRELVDDIAAGRFAVEWQADVEAGNPALDRARAQHAGAAVADFERELRCRLGPAATPST